MPSTSKYYSISLPPYVLFLLFTLLTTAAPTLNRSTTSFEDILTTQLAHLSLTHGPTLSIYSITAAAFPSSSILEASYDTTLFQTINLQFHTAETSKSWKTVRVLTYNPPHPSSSSSYNPYDQPFFWKEPVHLRYSPNDLTFEWEERKSTLLEQLIFLKEKKGVNRKFTSFSLWNDPYHAIGQLQWLFSLPEGEEGGPRQYMVGDRDHDLVYSTAAAATGGNGTRVGDGAVVEV